MTRKVITAIFDNDLRVELGKHEVSEDGTQIRIKSGGESHFMPSFDNDSFLEFPYRDITSFWKNSYRRVYIVKKKASACVDFTTEPPEIPLPNPEELKKANMALLAKRIGQDRTNDVPWFAWVQLALIGFLVLLQLGVI